MISRVFYSLLFLLVFDSVGAHPRRGEFLLQENQPQAASADSSGRVGSSRGLAEESKPFDPLKTGSRIVFFVPRIAVNTFFNALNAGVSVVSDPQFIAQVEDLMFIVDHRLGWYPNLELSSGFLPLYGATLFYHGNHYGGSAGGSFGSSDRWKASVNLKYNWETRNAKWGVDVTAVVEENDDREFYGIGSDPRLDARSFFLPTSSLDQATFFEERFKTQFELHLAPSKTREWYWAGFFQKRKAEDAADQNKSLGDAFDLEQLPGVGQSSVQVYNEIGFRHDSRLLKGEASKGLKSELYAGFSQGIASDNSRFVRFGSDVSYFFPFLKAARFIVPRIVIDGFEDIGDGEPVSFVEYPRQPLYRGVSDRELYRTDKLTALSSLEYQWPVTYNLAGILYYDFLMVSDAVGDFNPGDGVWAAGFGLNVKTRNRTFGSFNIGTGSKGIRLFVVFGFSLSSNYRLD